MAWASRHSDYWVGPNEAPDTYELITELGSGSEGRVWKAVLPLSKSGRRFVAVKILSEDDGEELDQWVDTAHLLLTLDDPGLVRVITFFSGPDRHRRGTASVPGTCRYLVMEHVEGISLSQWVLDHPEALAAARLDQLRDIARALDELHSGRSTAVPVIHGDVKPDNIIIRPNGGSVLVDLGLARLVDGTGRLGRTNPYAAPELHSTGGLATPATDAFAFVATAAQALTGQVPPLDEDGRLDIVALRRHLQQSPATANRPSLCDKVIEALSAAAGDRPAHHLSRWLNAVTTTAPPTNPVPAERESDGATIQPTERQPEGEPPGGTVGSRGEATAQAAGERTAQLRRTRRRHRGVYILLVVAPLTAIALYFAVNANRGAGTDSPPVNSGSSSIPLATTPFDVNDKYGATKGVVNWFNRSVVVQGTIAAESQDSCTEIQLVFLGPNSADGRVRLGEETKSTCDDASFDIHFNAHDIVGGVREVDITFCHHQDSSCPVSEDGPRELVRP